MNGLNYIYAALCLSAYTFFFFVCMLVSFLFVAFTKSQHWFVKSFSKLFYILFSCICSMHVFRLSRLFDVSVSFSMDLMFSNLMLSLS